MPRRFSLEELSAATDGFSKMLGQGGFGSVYEGSIADGTAVAVKRLDGLGQQGKKEFLAEVQTIGKVYHMNLVKLIGYCAAKSCRLLVYEFMPNGSLDRWIFPPRPIIKDDHHDQLKKANPAPGASLRVISQAILAAAGFFAAVMLR